MSIFAGHFQRPFRHVFERLLLSLPLAIVTSIADSWLLILVKLLSENEALHFTATSGYYCKKNSPSFFWTIMLLLTLFGVTTLGIFVEQISWSRPGHLEQPITSTMLTQYTVHQTGRK